MAQELHEFILDDGAAILLNVGSGVFLPTATTTSLISAVKEYVRKPGKLLDLGAGSGVVGIALSLMGLVNAPLYASDLSENAKECLLENCERYDVLVKGETGSLFNPWANEKFDYIVDDISGVAEEVAKISPWFKNIPCQSGMDGTDLTIQVLRNAPLYLNRGGLLFFPIISLSNADKILNVAREEFSCVKLLRKDEWPLPKDMYEHVSILKRMQEDGYIKIRETFGMILFGTNIYVASNK